MVQNIHISGYLSKQKLIIYVGGGGCSQGLLSLNPTTVMVVLLLGLLGCDKIYQSISAGNLHYMVNYLFHWVRNVPQISEQGVFMEILDED